MRKPDDDNLPILPAHGFGQSPTSLGAERRQIMTLLGTFADNGRGQLEREFTANFGDGGGSKFTAQIYKDMLALVGAHVEGEAEGIRAVNGDGAPVEGISLEKLKSRGRITGQYRLTISPDVMTALKEKAGQLKSNGPAL